MSQKLNSILKRFEEIERDLSSSDIMSDMKKLTALSQERVKLFPVAQAAEQKTKIETQIKEISEQLTKEKDNELKEILEDELVILEEKFEKLNEKIEEMLLPQDPQAGKNVFLEIRAGTGGEEAALFARDLFRMYSRFFEKSGLKYELVYMQDTGLHGIKEVVILVKGDKAYEFMHLEGGGHRVQRIPETESGGRIHTSACTVAVTPEVEESEFEINMADLRIDVFRSSGPGGQSVNTTDSAVRITHVPTGIVVSCQDEKSQHKNKAKALKILRARIAESERQAQNAKLNAEKKAQVGSGDRSEKIRTYNFPQNRITDHRINYTMHSLDRALEGEIDELIEALLKEEKKKKLEAINS
ncbi:MAG: peptide chain release factor 1 [Spirochaetia bacterium]|nr:peptide chain release factor 1 [Spirochaetia bacterium]